MTRLSALAEVLDSLGAAARGCGRRPDPASWGKPGRARRGARPIDHPGRNGEDRDDGPATDTTRFPQGGDPCRCSRHDPRRRRLPAFAGASANEKVRFACIGVGGKGESDTNDAGAHGEIVALCDIDSKTLDKMAAKFPDAKKYFDYRKMLEDLGDKIDAVTVSTPDHTHAPASVMAMRMGKHCFCQKPLTWSIEEARVMRELAAEKKLATQMGNQGTADDGFRRGVEVIRSGILGPIQEIHVWTNRPIWPQGVSPPQGRGEGPREHPLGRVPRRRPRSPLPLGLSPRSTGEAGSTSAPAPWATWPATPSTSPRWPWASSTPSRSRSSTPPASSTARPTPSGRSSAPSSASATAAPR